MPFRRRSGDLEKLYQAYKDKVEFLFVYIREAHPDSTVYLTKEGGRVLEKIAQTNDIKERKERAESLRAELKLSFPALVDRDDNKVNTAYAAWPERLVVVDTAGKVAYKGRPGPKGFEPNEVKAWLEKNVK